MKALTILYHDVVQQDLDESGFPGAAAGRYKMYRPEFDRHLQEIQTVSRLAATGVNTLLEDTGSGDTGVQPFLFTIDDGGSSALHIAERLEQQGWCGHFFITTDQIGNRAFVTEAQVRELHGRGHVIGSHSCSHPHRMAELPTKRLDAEWRDSVARLSDILGEEVVTGSVPGGFYRRNVARSAIAAGIRALFTSEPTMKVEQLDGCLIFGRYNVYGGMSATAAAALVSEKPYARIGQKAMWNGKKVLKTVAAPIWDRTRDVVFGHRK